MLIRRSTALASEADRQTVIPTGTATPAAGFCHLDKVPVAAQSAQQ